MLEEQLRQLGLEFAVLIAGSPGAWAQEARWLETLQIDPELPPPDQIDVDSALKPIEAIAGPDLRRLTTAWEAVAYTNSPFEFDGRRWLWTGVTSDSSRDRTAEMILHARDYIQRFAQGGAERTPTKDAGMENVDQAIKTVVAGGKQQGAMNEACIAALADDAWMTHSDIAKYHEVDAESLRKRLERFRARNHNGWKEVEDRSPREPKYLFRYGDVKAIVVELQASGKASGERPAK